MGNCSKRAYKVQCCMFIGKWHSLQQLNCMRLVLRKFSSPVVMFHHSVQALCFFYMWGRDTKLNDNSSLDPVITKRYPSTDGNLCHSFTMLLTGFQQDAVRTPWLILIGIRSQAKPGQWAAYMGNLPLIYYSEHSLGCSSHRNVTEISKHSSMHLKRNLQILKATVFFLFFRFLSS